MDEDFILKLTDLISRFMRFRPRTKEEVRRYIIKVTKRNRIEVDTDIVEVIIQELLLSGRLNDEIFARWWINERQYFKPRGVKTLRGELFQKGVPETIIEKTIIEAQLQDKSEAVSALMKRPQLIQKEKREKALAFLMRRGFSFSDARNAFEELLSKE